MKNRLDCMFSYFVLRPLFKAILKLFFALEVEGAEILKQNPGAVIFAGNHTGFLDGPIVLSCSNRPLLFIMANGVLGWPIIGGIVRWLGVLTIQNRNAKKSLKNAVQYLKVKQALCIFPEGGLSQDGQMSKFYGGVSFLHTQSQVPIIPFAIHGGYEAWSWGEKMPTFCKITLKFGNPIMLPTHRREEILTQLFEAVRALKYSLECRDGILVNDLLPNVSCLVE